MIGTLLAAVALGFVGSLHCAGMCGPLVIAGAMREGRASARALTSYLLGRLCSYAFVGALMGQIGAHALHRIPVQPFQAAVAAVVAAFAIWKAFRLSPRASQGGSLLVWLVRFLPRRGLGLGLATGFLPCGLLVPAWLLAASSGSAAAGALTMAAFFAATAPALVMPLALVRVAQRYQFRFPGWAQSAGWLLLAVWLAIRPLVAISHHH